MSATFDTFLESFVGSLAEDAFYQGESLPQYLSRPADERGNDEADVVDDKIVSVLIHALGYTSGERQYNRSHSGGKRTDFTIRIPASEYPKPCAVIESKNTATRALEEHLPQLEGYLRAQGAQRGVLVDGKRLLAYELASPVPIATADFSLHYLVDLWRGESLYARAERGRAALPDTEVTKLRAFWQRFNRGAYMDASRLVRELTRTKSGEPHALDGSTWNESNAQLQLRKPDDARFVDEVRELIGDVRTDVEAQLTLRLEKYDEFREALEHLPGSTTRVGDEYGNHLRNLLESLERIGIKVEDRNSLQFRLEGQLERLTERELVSGVGAELLKLVNEQLKLNAATSSTDTSEAQAVFEGAKEAPKPKRGAPKQASLQDDVTATLERMQKLLSDFHERRENLAKHYRPEVAVHEAFETWREKVATLLLRGASPERLRREFALQTSYVLIVRMLLVRILEDKGLLERVFTNGGLSLWFDQVEPRYLKYAQGKGTDYLLDMAYTSAQHVYAHFYAERLLFDWYYPERNLVIRILHRLAGYDLSTINDDVIGHVYGGYVKDDHKHESGMYYTPPEVVEYILDRLGYSGPEIIGKKILDPACGSGTFLVSAARRLVQAYRDYHQNQIPTGEIQNILDTVKGSLYGLDLNPFACYLAETNLLIQVLDLIKQALDEGESVALDRFHVHNTDTLTYDAKTLAVVKGTLAFPADGLPTAEKIKAKRGTVKLSEQSEVDLSQGFEFLVANPPYVKADEGSEGLLNYRSNIKLQHPFLEVREVLKKKWDLFVPFVALGWSLLSEGGRMGMITSNGVEMVPYAESLRTLLAEKSRIDEVSFFPGVRLFDDAQVENTIFFATKQHPESVHNVVNRWHGGKSPLVTKEERRSQTNFGERIFRQMVVTASNEGMAPLESICYISKGMVLHSEEGHFKKDDLIAESRDKSHPVLYIKGEDIEPFELSMCHYLEYGPNLRAPQEVSRQTFGGLYNTPKLLRGETSAAWLDYGDLADGWVYANHSVIVITPWHNLVGIENRSITQALKALSQSRQALEKQSKSFPLEFLLAIVNSPVAIEVLKSLTGSARKSRFHPQDFKALPIPRQTGPETVNYIVAKSGKLREIGLGFLSLRRQGWKIKTKTHTVESTAQLLDNLSTLSISSAKIRWGLQVHDENADVTGLTCGGRSLFRGRRQEVLSVPESVPEAGLEWLRRQFSGLEKGTSFAMAEARGLRVPASPEAAVEALRALEAREAEVREKVAEFGRLKAEVDVLVAALYESDSAEMASG